MSHAFSEVLGRSSGDSPCWRVVAAALALASLVAGCGPVPEPQRLATTLLDSCGTVAEGAPLALRVPVPRAGAVRIEVQEQGVAASVEVIGAGGARVEVASPVARSAWHLVLVPAAAREILELRIASRDTAPAGGTVCVRARMPAAEGPQALAAARDLSAAGSAAAVRHWREALGRYAAAARRLDALQRPIEAARTRLAMAAIADHQAGGEIDALALVSDARTSLEAAQLGGREPALRGNLLATEAASLMETSGPEGKDATVRRLLREARQAFRGVPGAAREFPRLDTLDGYWNFLLENRTAAAAAFDAAARDCAALADAECEAQALQNRAGISKRDGRPQRAEREYLQALAVLPADRQPELAADIYDNLSLLRGDLGLYSSAEPLALDAMRLHALAGDCEGARRSLDGIGRLLAEVGDTATARDYLQWALRACAPLLESIGPAGTRAPQASGQAPRLPCSLPDSRPDRESADSMARAVVTLAALDLASGDIAGARACDAAARPLQALPATRFRLAVAAADTDLAAGDFGHALVRLEAAERDALELRLTPDQLQRRQLDVEFARALLLAQRPGEAWLRASRALRMGAGRSEPGQFLEALRVAGESLREAGLVPEAIGLLRAGTALAERIPVTALGPEAGATFIASQHVLYSELTDLLASAGEDWQALEVAESGRLRAARAALARTRRNETGEAEAEGAGDLLALRSNLGRLVVDGGAPRALSVGEARRLTQQLEAALGPSAGPGAPAGGEAGTDLARAAARLSGNGTVVEYATAGNDLVAFVIRGGTLRAVRLGARASIAARASHFLDLLQDPDTPPPLLGAAAARLAERIWWPLELHGSQSIVIVPEEVLSEVPFAALPWSAATADMPVLEQTRTSVIPSLLYAMAQPPLLPRAGAGAYVVVGNPVFRSVDWRRLCGPSRGGDLPPEGPVGAGWTERLASLPGAAIEVQEITALTAKLRRDSTTVPLLGCAATAAHLRQLAGAPLTLLHLATHARIDTQRPRLSAIALTPEWDGSELRATLGYAEIVAMRLQARLVVLGACETSRGQVLAGEGVLGPAQAFLQGGAQSVIGTLWSVDDRSTAMFMERLYQHLLADRMPIGEALRRTQLDFRRAPGGSSSHFWAAFTAYGEADSKI